MLFDSLRQRAQRVFYGWWIVLAGFAIQAFNGCLLFHGFGAYVLPLQAEFSWSRAQISGVFSIVFSMLRTSTFWWYTRSRTWWRAWA